MAKQRPSVSSSFERSLGVLLAAVLALLSLPAAAGEARARVDGALRADTQPSAPVLVRDLLRAMAQDAESSSPGGADQPALLAHTLARQSHARGASEPAAVTPRSAAPRPLQDSALAPRAPPRFL